jgi:hypothetical protein
MHNDAEKPDGTKLPYATDEIEIPMLGKAGVALIVFFVMNLAIAAGAYYIFVVRETPPTQVSVFGSTPKIPDPNVPILQAHPEVEIHKFRADEYDAEHSYAHWKDGDNKESLRIPISRAMEIVKQHGLPKAVKAAAVTPVQSNASGEVVKPAPPRSPSLGTTAVLPAPITEQGAAPTGENSDAVHLPVQPGAPPAARP